MRRYQPGLFIRSRTIFPILLPHWPTTTQTPVVPPRKPPPPSFPHPRAETERAAGGLDVPLRPTEDVAAQSIHEARETSLAASRTAHSNSARRDYISTRARREGNMIMLDLEDFQQLFSSIVTRVAPNSNVELGPPPRYEE